MCGARMFEMRARSPQGDATTQRRARWAPVRSDTTCRRRGAPVGVNIGAPLMPFMFERERGQCEVRLRVPPSVGHLRTVRMVAADVAERAGFDYDEIYDLRIAVSELCHAVMRSTEAPIKLRFAIRPRCIEVHGSAERRGDAWALALSPLAELIVGFVSDRFALVDGVCEVGFLLVNRALAAPSGTV